MLRAAWRFRCFLRPFLPAFAVGTAFVVLATLADLVQPWPLKVIIDGAIDHKAQHGWLAELMAGGARDSHAILVRALLATVFLVGVSALFDFASDYLMSGSGEKVMARIRASLFSHLQRLSLSYHDQQRVGDLVSRLTTDIDRVQNMVVAVFDTLIPSSVMLLGLAVAMVAINPSFGLLALSIAPPLFLVTYRFTLRIKRAARTARDADAVIAALASETLSAVRTVQAFSREDHEDFRFAMRNDESLNAGLVAVKLKAAFTPVVDLVALGGTVLVTYVGVEQVLARHMTLGLLLVFLFYLKSLYKPMRALSKLAYLVSQGTVSAERVHEVLLIDQRIPQQPGARPAPPLAGRVELVGVTFRYAPDRRPVLENASLRVEPGERVGIVGRTGAGKSTLVSLIPRFRDPEHGVLLLDGTDVRDFELTSLRRQVSLVLQEPVLFFGSILANVRYGNPGAPFERVSEVIDAAHVREFLDRLPDGILTPVGERGATLSVGQRQRIAIARAMLCDAPILILDEPTTGLDRDSEELVLDGLARLSVGKTTFVISHQDASLVGVDRVVRLEEGRLLEQPPLRSGADLRWRRRRTADISERVHGGIAAR